MSWGRGFGPSVSGDMGACIPIYVVYSCSLVFLRLNLCTFPSYEKIAAGTIQFHDVGRRLLTDPTCDG